jgi:hypothetical protein
MPSLLVIRLHPVEPISGNDFLSYLAGLTITAFEISFNNQAGSQINQAQYLPPDNPATRIVQHFDGGTLKAIATAVIEIPTPPAGGEYRTADIRLEITRGSSAIIHKQTYYNVPVRAGGFPVPPAPPINPLVFTTWPETSLHLALPSPGQQLSTTLAVPEDGTAPNFANLRTAVETVLNADPGSTTGIANLTAAQCRHIAYEIIWDRMAYPLPKPKRALEKIYTGPLKADSDEERDRRIFEGDLLTYYTRHNAEADKKRSTAKKTKNPFISKAIA